MTQIGSWLQAFRSSIPRTMSSWNAYVGNEITNYYNPHIKKWGSCITKRHITKADAYTAGSQ